MQGLLQYRLVVLQVEPPFHGICVLGDSLVLIRGLEVVEDRDHIMHRKGLSWLMLSQMCCMRGL